MPDRVASELPLKWEKLRILSGVIASILVPVAITLTGHVYSKATKEKEIGVRYVEIAIQILQTRPEKQTAELRKWAIDIIDHYSEVHLPPAAIDELKLQQLRSDLRRIEAESDADRRKIERLQGGKLYKEFDEFLRLKNLPPNESSKGDAAKNRRAP